MSCIFSYNAENYAYIAADSLSTYWNEKGKRDKRGDKYIDKITEVNNCLVGVYGQTTYNAYGENDIHKILKKISYGYNATVARLERLAKELKEQIREGQKLGFVVLYCKNDKIYRHVIQVSHNDDDFSLPIRRGGGFFTGTFYEEALDIDIDDEVTDKDYNAVINMVQENIKLDTQGVIGGNINLWKINNKNEIQKIQ